MKIKKLFSIKRRSGPERHYVDDVKLTAVLIEFQKATKEAEKQGLPKPIVPDFLANSIILMARKFARAPNFSGYPFIEDMIGDAILCCFKNLHNFDSTKYKESFPYFSMAVKNSFIQRILKEQGILYRKYKAELERSKDLIGIPGMDRSHSPANVERERKMREFCEKFEKRLAEKRAKSKARKKAQNALKDGIEFDLDMPTIEVVK